MGRSVRFEDAARARSEVTSPGELPSSRRDGTAESKAGQPIAQNNRLYIPTRLFNVPQCGFYIPVDVINTPSGVLYIPSCIFCIRTEVICLPAGVLCLPTGVIY